MINLKEKLIEILIETKSIPRERLEKLVQQQKKSNIPLRKLLIKERIITEHELLAILSQHLYLPTLHLGKYKFDSKIIDLVGEQFCRKYGIIPLSRIGDTMTVAMSDPLNIFVLDDLSEPELRCSDLDQFIRMCRHFRCVMMIATQDTCNLPKKSRNQYDYLHIYKNMDDDRLELIYKLFQILCLE